MKRRGKESMRNRRVISWRESVIAIGVPDDNNNSFKLVTVQYRMRNEDAYGWDD